MPQAPKKILIVDDDGALVKALKEKFVIEGFSVLEAKNGKAALKLIFEKNPDLILLDIIMPGMHGFEVIKELQNDKKSEEIPLLILTNFPEYPGLTDVVEKGKYEVISKSKSKLDDLVKRVKAKLAD